MSDSMVEIVARAIYEGRNGPGCVPWARHPSAHKAPYLSDARAAIAAMRKPTAAMMQAGCASNPPGQYHADTKLSEIIGAEWQAMIDEALKEK